MKFKSNKKLVLFDGVCNMCDNTVQFIIKYDSKEQFVFSSLQGETAKELLVRFNIENQNLTSIILYDNNRIYNKSTAVLKIAKQLKFPINLTVIFLLIPKFIRDFIYNIIKNNRYKWFGKKTECPIPNPELRAKFLP